MTNSARSHLAASIAGGLIVAGGLLALGVGGRQSTQTIIAQAPVAAAPVAGESSSLTPGAIYDREARGVVYVTSQLSAPVESPFDVLHQASTGRLTGSGFLVDRRGDILTNYHLIEAAGGVQEVTVGFMGGVQRAARLVGADPGGDVAVLRVNMHGVPPVQPLALGDSTSVRIGDPALAMGDPYGLDRTLSSGIVSGLEHQLVANDGAVVDNVIQTDVSPAASSSGGPLLDAAGRVIGVESDLVGRDGTTVPFATPIDTVAPILYRIQGGRLTAPRLARTRRQGQDIDRARRTRMLRMRFRARR